MVLKVELPRCPASKIINLCQEVVHTNAPGQGVSPDT